MDDAAIRRELGRAVHNALDEFGVYAFLRLDVTVHHHRVAITVTYGRDYVGAVGAMHAAVLDAVASWDRDFPAGQLSIVFVCGD